MRKCDICNSEIKVGDDFYELIKWHYKSEKYCRPRKVGMRPLLTYPAEPKTLNLCVGCVIKRLGVKQV